MTAIDPPADPESRRLAEADRDTERVLWRRWGPYLADRQWGTVREDYSKDGNAWDYLPHDAARSRAYRWGEDGLAGICDRQQRLCFALALWNGRDPILKERLFGLTNAQGNHGEDVKEVYYHLDATPTSSYLRMLYKYPQAEFPYARLVEENARRTREDREFELVDTGVFAEDRYFDVDVEYAKAGFEDILIRLTATNRGPDAAPLWLLPQLWFRNVWSWDAVKPERPQLSVVDGRVRAVHATLGTMWLVNDAPGGAAELMFCDNDTNGPKLFNTPAEPGRSYKDAFHEAIVHGRREALAALGTGTKMAVGVRREVPGGSSTTLRLRLSRQPAALPFVDFDETFAQRKREADAFYSALPHVAVDADDRKVQRQAFAGLLWSKQFYAYDVPVWLQGDSAQPPPPAERRKGRNVDWIHLNNADVLSMPDSWEYPWYASWDLAFHCVALAEIDPESAKGQLVLLLREWYMHPNGELPAYEWALGDANPPVHAWAALSVYRIDRERTGVADHEFLERVFHKLLLNFTWWVNRKDASGHNVFQGGFLGLDNIGVFDRNSQLPDGGQLDQADATGWMAMYSLNLLRIALELAKTNRVYEDVATKFFEHFLYVAAALANLGAEAEADGIDFWDDQDNFFYDVLRLPDGRTERLRVRSIVGLIPIFAVQILDTELLSGAPQFAARMQWFLDNRPDLARLVSRFRETDAHDRSLLGLLRRFRLKSVLARMLDEREFLSPFGVRALSRVYGETPYSLTVGASTFTVAYEPGESTSGVFGGNSNWRGPVWMPVNFLLVESLHRFGRFYGDDFKVECPTGSGVLMTLDQVADELKRRLGNLFRLDESGRRPIFGDDEKQQTDPHFRDHLLFPEYFHGDTGRGVGAMHQTGWTALIAQLLAPSPRADPTR
ncbi:MAG: glucosidase [Acidobacteriota bacterium]